MSDTIASDIDFKNKMVWVWTTLKYRSKKTKVIFENGRLWTVTFWLIKCPSFTWHWLPIKSGCFLFCQCFITRHLIQSDLTGNERHVKEELFINQSVTVLCDTPIWFGSPTKNKINNVTLAHNILHQPKVKPLKKKLGQLKDKISDKFKQYRSGLNLTRENDDETSRKTQLRVYSIYITIYFIRSSSQVNGSG